MLRYFVFILGLAVTVQSYYFKTVVKLWVTFDNQSTGFRFRFIVLRNGFVCPLWRSNKEGQQATLCLESTEEMRLTSWTSYCRMLLTYKISSGVCIFTLSKPFAIRNTQYELLIKHSEACVGNYTGCFIRKSPIFLTGLISLRDRR